MGVLRWLFGVFITGTLIGLGGPFWFDVATKLSSFRQRIRGGKDQKDAGGSKQPGGGKNEKSDFTDFGI